MPERFDGSGSVRRFSLMVLRFLFLQEVKKTLAISLAIILYPSD